MFPGCPASPADPSMFPPRVRRRRDAAERSVRELFIQIVDHRFRHPTRCRPIAPRARIGMAAQFESSARLMNTEAWPKRRSPARSEEHTSELQSLRHLVCRLLLEKKKSHTPRLYI